MVFFGTREGGQVPGVRLGGASATSTTPSSGIQAENFRFWTAKAAPMNGGAPFASLSSSILEGLGKPGTSGGRSEPHTGYEFPPEFCYLKTKQCPSLAGLGVRSKRIVIKDINVYALGIYVDAAAAKQALAPYKKKPVAELEKDQGFYDAVTSSPSVEKTLRLVISSRLVDRKKFLDALEERLAPRVKEAGDPAALETFKKQFDGVHFEKGLEIAFTFVPGSSKQLVTQIAGTQKGSISSPALYSSLLDIFLGVEPVSKDAKATFGRSLAAAIRE